MEFKKDQQYYKFCAYGFLKNLRFFDAFLLLFLVEKGLDYTAIGILYASREIFINILEIPSGIVADTYGRKNALAGSFIAYIVSFWVFYSYNDFWWLLAAFLLYGAGDAFRSGTHKGMIMDYLKQNGWSQHKINYYGHTRSWSQRGSAISSLVAGFIVFYSGKYEHIFLYSIVPYLFNFFLILSYPESINYASKAKEKVKIKSTFLSFFKTIRQRDVLQVISSAAFFSAYLKAVKDYIQPIMVHVALLIPLLMSIESGKKNGVIIGIIYFVIYLLTSGASRFSAVFNNKIKGNAPQITQFFGFIAGIACGVFFIYEWWIASLVAFIAIYLIENIRKPILTGFVANRVAPEILTSVLSAQSLLRTIITVVLALGFGVLADHFGIGVSFVVLTGILLAAMFLVREWKAIQA